jgi:DNA-binding winged helix-turn-helix (wHTH) protein
MTTARRISDVLAESAAAGFVGRQRELQLLAEFANGADPSLLWIYGMAGIGKTALLQEFSARRRASNCGVTIRLDCHFIEPSPEGFLFALQSILQRPVETVEAAVEALSAPVAAVLVLDSYEVLRLLDGWMRQVFVPALKENVRVVICGRYEPGSNWRTTLEWHGLIRTISLSPLTEGESVKLLEHTAVKEGDATLIYRMAGGHPMALVLASGAKGNSEWNKDGADSRNLVRQLTRLYLADVVDPNLRTAVEAASVVRRVTHSLLAAMAPEIYSVELYDALAALSIVEATGEGVMMCGQVQDAVSSWLCSSDPRRFNAYRRAAWRQVRAESTHAGPRERWRYTADLLYLVENPGLREAYFPTGAQSLSVEPARAGDCDAILAIAKKHEKPRAAKAIADWWRNLPESFSVMRDNTGEIAGFYIASELRSLLAKMPGDDPELVSLKRHLREHPLADSETALYLRRWLSQSVGESPSPAQAACWLDVKRSHMALRPRIRRCYGNMFDVGTFAPMLQPIGFRVVDSGSASRDGATCSLLMLDFGPGSFDGWLSDLVARELGIQSDDFLDVAARELVNDEGRVELTSLEFGVLTYLREREGKAVSRAELLEHVWGRRVNSGSNLIDVLIRSLRKKLGGRDWMVSTVRGIGYRYRSRQPSTNEQRKNKPLYGKSNGNQHLR